MNHAEALAQQLLEVLLVGVHMRYRHDQSHGEHDFDLCYPGGGVSAVEVTSSVDEAVKHTNFRIRDRRQGGQAVKANLCKKGWWIQTEPGADIRNIRGKADEYLAQIEAAGFERFFGPIERHPSVKRIFRDLRVCSGSVISWKRPGHIWIDLRGGGGRVDANIVIEAAKREACKNDNRKKLAATGTDERHLAVYVDPTNYRPWCALVDSVPLPELPHLPSEITDIWVFTETRSPHEYAVWRATYCLTWRSLGPLLLEVST